MPAFGSAGCVHVLFPGLVTPDSSKSCKHPSAGSAGESGAGVAAGHMGVEIKSGKGALAPARCRIAKSHRQEPER